MIDATRTVKEIKAGLDELGIKYTSTMNKAQLLGAYQGWLDAGTASVGGVSTASVAEPERVPEAPAETHDAGDGLASGELTEEDLELTSDELVSIGDDGLDDLDEIEAENDQADENAEGTTDEEAESVEVEAPSLTTQSKWSVYTREQLFKVLREQGDNRATPSRTKERLIQHLEARERGIAPVKEEQKSREAQIEELLIQLKNTPSAQGQMKKNIRNKLRRLGHFVSKAGK